MALDPEKPPLCGHNLTISYGGTPIVTGVDLTLEAGSMTIIVGPNGCGKSTLLKSLARVIPHQTGEVALFGQPIETLSNKLIARHLAFLPQGPIAPEGMSVEELVAQGRFPYQSFNRSWSAEDAAAVEQALRATDLLSLRAFALTDLSGGQRQRCWIAMVLAQQTDILLLDEPTTYLDLKIQIDLMRLLKRVTQEENRTLVVVLHELNIAAAFADRMVMMRDGTIQADGAVQDVFTRDHLKKVFDLDAEIMIDPKSGRPFCIPDHDARSLVAA